MTKLEKLIVNKYEGTGEVIRNIYVTPVKDQFSINLYYILLTYGKHVIEQVKLTVINDDIHTIEGHITIPMINQINNLIKEVYLDE